MVKVFLSAGHGGTDPGAISNNLKEKDINLNVLFACKQELECHGVKVACSRTKDEYDPVTEEVKEANALKADIAVSFHVNAGGGDGCEMYYYSISSKSKRLAGLLEKHIKSIGQNSRGIKNGNHLYFIKHTTMPSVLAESFFIDNSKDKTIGDTLSEQRALGIVYAKGILEYLGITYKKQTTLYRIQVGAYRDKSNADAMLRKLKAAGFSEAFVTTS